ncbi:MAG: glycoside hydrolase family 38 C-terminal domain-containing protein [Candidatus Latescibacteria bacterium]|jgi:alpha-mannosidase|nr:glycoside hydrolase family 38 C-terminal domain-containing protein [Candidatus Latescibacterota bacterium]
MPESLSAALIDLRDEASSAAEPFRKAVERFVGQAEFAAEFTNVHPEQEATWRALLEKAVGRVHPAVETGSLEDVKAATREAESLLAPIGTFAKEYTIWCVGHGHIDMNWMWSWPETVSVANDTFLTVDRLMEEYPDFCYSESQASVYDAIRLHNPALFERIRERIAQGQWEVTASTWVQGDKNLASGESLCRHYLYTRRFMQDVIGLGADDIPIDWEPDTFGHANTIPSFLARSGVTRYYMCRGGKNPTPEPSVFWWQAPDGSRVLVYREITWYNWEIDAGIAKHMATFAQETGMKGWMNVYGVGDHGGGPTRQHLDMAAIMNEWPIFPNIELSTTKPFYEMLEKHGDKWPVLDRELNFEFTGCYTTQASIKRANRYGAYSLVSAEAASVLGWKEVGVPYPEERLREGWIGVLFNQFHDILPGSGVKATTEYASAMFQETATRAEMTQTQSLRAIAAMVDTSSVRRTHDSGSKVGPAIGAGAGYGSGSGNVSGYDGGAPEDRPFVVFNPQGWSRSEVVAASVWNVDWEAGRIEVKNDEGRTIPAQVVGTGTYWGHKYTDVVFPATDVPPLGWRTYLVRQGHGSDTAPGVTSPAPGVMENEFVRVEIDNLTGGISHLIDKSTGIDLAVENDPMAVLEFCIERHHGMTAWVIGDLESVETPLKLKSLNFELGPHQGVATAKIDIHDSSVTLRTIVRAGDPRVEIEVSINWLERGTPERGVPMLRMRMPVALKDATPRYETPYGTVERDLSGGEEVPSQRWVDVCGCAGIKELWKDAGLLVSNDSKYGHSLDGSTLRTTLLRGSYDPDPLPDLGEHAIRMSVMPHSGGWTPADAIKAGSALNQPLVVVGADVHEGPLPISRESISFDAPNVILAAVKKAEGEDAVIIRMYETEGRDTCLAITLHESLCAAGATATQVDLLERPIEGAVASIDRRVITVDVPAHGITSIRVG